MENNAAALIALIYLMGIFGMYVLFSILAGVYYSSKEGAFWRAFLISLLFSPLIGFVFALASDPVDRKPCPACAEKIRAEASKCKHCGEQLEAAPAEEEPETKTLSESQARTSTVAMVFWGVGGVIVLLLILSSL